ncbi:MAG TPA: efflux RND transporter periplasmic adaptor subunit [Opitutaceae bacterium]|nr:efflux RND transporter periplasmic adaptor subunit [Opitutaceae bacterium]
MSLENVQYPKKHYTRTRRLALALVTLLALEGAGTYVVSRAQAAGTPASPGIKVAPPAPRVTVAPVEERVVTESEEITGRVDALETVELRARVSGQIEAVHFQSGQLVKAGDVLFTIDPRTFKAQFDMAQAEVERARVHVDIAQREANRAEELFRQKAISLEEADTRRSRLAEAKAAQLAAEAALATAKLDLDFTEVRAPIAGRISRAYVTPGNLVSGATGSATMLARIVTTDAAYVYADVDEGTVLRFNRLLASGQLPLENGHVPVVLQLGDESTYSRHGYLESTDNRVDPATGSLKFRMVFPNKSGELVPGLFARVRIPVSAPEKALLISERSIGTDQSQKFVFAVTPDHKVAYRTVKIGSSQEGLRVVRQGLKPGEQIIVNGLQRVRPGMVVEPELAVAANDKKNAAPTPDGANVAAN